MTCFASPIRVVCSSPILLRGSTSPSQDRQRSNHLYMVLGFALELNQYKLIKLYTEYHSSNIWRGKIHTLGSDTHWRIIGVVPYRFSQLDRIPECPNTYLDGRLYWVVNSSSSSSSSSLTSPNDWICWFDLESERFGLLASSPEVSTSSS